jgi:hypothetical protein
LSEWSVTRRPSTAWTATISKAAGDRINRVLAAAGYNLGLLLRWLAELLHTLIRMLTLSAPKSTIA